MKKLLYILAGVSLFFSCDNDIEVNANWKDVPVVYGLLNSAEDTVWVRVSKAFLGEGDVIRMAQEPDSLYYNNIESIFLEELDESGNLVDTINLVADFTTRSKDDGVFTTDNYRLYRTGTVALDETSEYRLVINRGDNRQQITAKTELVKDFDIIKPRNNQTVGFSSLTNEQSIEWESAENGRLYEVRLFFRYTEIRISDFTSPVDMSDSTQKVFEFRMSDKTATTLTGGQALSTTSTGQSFLNSLLRNVSQDPNLVRIPRKFDVEISVASEDFVTFINVNKPPTGIVRERPDFTNVFIGDDEGVGIFASRFVKTRETRVSSGTIDFLSIDDFACGYNFLRVTPSQSANDFKAEYDSPDCSTLVVFEFNQ